ncbi:unnamed protein product, partial [Oikopleura dioica]
VEWAVDNVIEEMEIEDYIMNVELTDSTLEQTDITQEEFQILINNGITDIDSYFPENPIDTIVYDDYYRRRREASHTISRRMTTIQLRSNKNLNKKMIAENLKVEMERKHLSILRVGSS